MFSIKVVSRSSVTWAAAHQASLSAGFPKQEYCSGFPFPSSGDLPHPGAEPECLMPPALAGRLFTPESSGELGDVIVAQVTVASFGTSFQNWVPIML